jgi:hypothetical protein
VSLLLIVTPLFWPLSLPTAGLSAGLGLVGLVAAGRDREDRLVPALGTVAGLLALFLSASKVVTSVQRLNDLFTQR